MRDDEMEKAEISEGLAEAGLASSCQLGVNGARSGSESDTHLTREVSPSVRRQLMTLAKVYEQTDPYYRAALRPIIKTVMAHNAEER